jgi:histone H3/H4
MMKTGFGESSGAYEESQQNALIGILLPVIEKSVVLAAQYCKACGRDAILPEDMEYAIKYCAMYTVGQNIGSLFPEVYDEELADGEEEDFEEVEPDECPPFVRYSGEDPTFRQMNEAYDRWDTWIPQSPIEEMLKNGINSNEYIGAGGLDNF